jgi:hypothetical protein
MGWGCFIAFALTEISALTLCAMASVSTLYTVAAPPRMLDAFDATRPEQ